MQNNIPIIAPIVRAPWLSLVIYGNFALFSALTGGSLKYQQRKNIFLDAGRMFQVIVVLKCSI